MERHHRLAGAGGALDDGDAGHGRPDHLVLFGLDGGDVVTHAARAGRRQRSEERSLAHQRAVGWCVGAEGVVVDAEQATATTVERPPPVEAHRVGVGRPVERPGDAGPPVDDQRFLIVVEHTDSADVVALAVGSIDAAEHQRRVTPAQLAGPAASVLGEPLAFEAFLEGATRSLVVVERDRRGVVGTFADGVEDGVGPVDVGLLACEFGGDRRRLSHASCDHSGASRGAPHVW